MLEIRNLSVVYKRFFALKDINLRIEKGERIGILGQSGSGKTTLSKVIAGIEKDFRGEIIWDSPKRKIQFVFQDSASSLNPRMRIFDIVTESLMIYGVRDRGVLKELFEKTMVEVGLSPDIAFKYPYQLSGGQRQRVSIARALIVEPDLLLCDEPISSLDISLAGQIINLIDEIQKRHGFALIFVSHDISSIYYLTHRAVVLLKGQVVEEGPTQSIIERPLHPYTSLLLSCVLGIEKRMRFEFSQIWKKIESSCPFAERCMYAGDPCKDYRDEFYSYDDGHRVKCVRFREILDEKISS